MTSLTDRRYNRRENFGIFKEECGGQPGPVSGNRFLFVRHVPVFTIKANSPLSFAYKCYKRASDFRACQSEYLIWIYK